MSPRKPKSQSYRVKVGSHTYPFIYYTADGHVTAPGIVSFTAKSPQDARDTLRKLYTDWENRVGAFSRN